MDFVREFACLISISSEMGRFVVAAAASTAWFFSFTFAPPLSPTLSFTSTAWDDISCSTCIPSSKSVLRYVVLFFVRPPKWQYLAWRGSFSAFFFFFFFPPPAKDSHLFLYSPILSLPTCQSSTFRHTTGDLDFRKSLPSASHSADLWVLGPATLRGLITVTLYYSDDMTNKRCPFCPTDCGPDSGVS